MVCVTTRSQAAVKPFLEPRRVRLEEGASGRARQSCDNWASRTYAGRAHTGRSAHSGERPCSTSGMWHGAQAWSRARVLRLTCRSQSWNTSSRVCGWEPRAQSCNNWDSRMHAGHAHTSCSKRPGRVPPFLPRPSRAQPDHNPTTFSGTSSRRGMSSGGFVVLSVDCRRISHGAVFAGETSSGSVEMLCNLRRDKKQMN